MLHPRQSTRATRVAGCKTVQNNAKQRKSSSRSHAAVRAETRSQPWDMEHRVKRMVGRMAGFKDENASARRQQQEGAQRVVTTPARHDGAASAPPTPSAAILQARRRRALLKCHTQVGGASNQGTIRPQSTAAVSRRVSRLARHLQASCLAPAPTSATTSQGSTRSRQGECAPGSPHSHTWQQHGRGACHDRARCQVHAGDAWCHPTHWYTCRMWQAHASMSNMPATRTGASSLQGSRQHDTPNGRVSGFLHLLRLRHKQLQNYKTTQNIQNFTTIRVRTRRRFHVFPETRHAQPGLRAREPDPHLELSMFSRTCTQLALPRFLRRTTPRSLLRSRTTFRAARCFVARNLSTHTSPVMASDESKEGRSWTTSVGSKVRCAEVFVVLRDILTMMLLFSGRICEEGKLVSRLDQGRWLDAVRA